jgi:hypothetical protein
MPPFVDKFAAGQAYSDFLAQYATAEQRRRWEDVRRSIVLTAAQQDVLGSFVRELHVLVMAGAWCGDCIEQCPIFEVFAAASPKILVRYCDRDAHADLAAELRTCGAPRVPAVVFLSEDGEFCGRAGDRTLSKYRRMMSQLGGAACPLGLTSPEGLREAVVQDWLNEFERIHAMLRLSGRLRSLHGD